MELLEILAWLAGAGGAVGLATAIPMSMRAFGNARLVASMPPTPIARLDPGLHEVKGVVRGGEARSAPVSRRACVYLRLLLEQRRRGAWETVLDLRQAPVIRLDEEGSACEVDLSAAEVVIAAPSRVRTGLFTVPGEELDQLLAQLDGVELQAQPAGPFLRWREEVLVEGDEVFAVGTARRDDDGAWRLTAEDGPFVVSDRDEAEVIRHQRQTGRRWAGVAAACLVACAWGLSVVGPALLDLL